MVKRKLWKKLAETLPPNEEQQSRGMRLFNQWENNRILFLTGKEIRETEPEIIIDFFRRLEMLHSPVSPVLRKKDSRWMANRDILKIEWEEEDEPSLDFLYAAFFAACSRSQSVLLAPFTARELSGTGAIISHTLINPCLENRLLRAAGITGSVQLEALADAVHCMGKTFGSELSYFVHCSSAPVIRRPDLFRWISLGDLSGDGEIRDIRGVFDQETQGGYHRTINELVNSCLQEGIPHESLVERIREAGFFPVPASEETGGAIPSELRFDDKGAPCFKDSVSNESSVPFCFYFSGGEENQGAIDYYRNIYIRWRDHYRFDYLSLSGLNFRYDKTDNYCESPGSEVIFHVIEAARKNGKKRTGIVLSGDYSFTRFLEQEADLLHKEPVRNSLSCLDRANLNREINLCESLAALNINQKKRRSPLRAYLKRADGYIDGIKYLRDFFLARFLFTGAARTPLLKRNPGMICFPSGEGEFELSESCRIMEEIYLRNLSYLENAKLSDYKIYETYGWWLLTYRKAYFLALVSLDNDSASPPRPDPVKIPSVSGAYRERTILEYDFKRVEGNLMLSGGSLLDPGTFEYRGFRLFSIL